MVTNCGQVCLFEKSEYVLSGVEPTKRRIHYKLPTYKKVYQNDNLITEGVKDDIKTWGEMKLTYLKLANFFPLPFGSTEQVFNFGSIRVWKQEYTNQYYYYNSVRYKEIPDFFLEAEIIGTEKWSVEDRLNIHKELLENLRNGMNQEDIELWLQKKM
jgi:hypothetical protein